MYSQYGSTLDVLAPSAGGYAGITSTDRTGNNGYVAGDYVAGLSGTSFSTPLAAGIAALMLSQNPHLTAAGVRATLQNTADKFGGNNGDSAYTNGFNSFYGYGRVNAEAALEAMPPQVLNVTISSTVTNPYGTNPPYEFDAVVGSEEQLRTVPVGGANGIAVQFSEDVVISQGDLELIALNQVVVEPSATSFDAPTSTNNFTATWTFPGILPAAQYLMVLSGDIEDLTGNALDGDWTNPGSINSSVTTSVFPSGDGVAGGDFEFVFTYLLGDANRDLNATLADQTIVATHLNDMSGNKSWTQGDYTGDGLVTIADQTWQSTYLNKADWRNLLILGDYDADFDLQADDESDFLGFYNTQNSNADLNDDGQVTTADYDAFYALYNFGVDLDVVT
jgi:hypothetical protein